MNLNVCADLPVRLLLRDLTELTFCFTNNNKEKTYRYVELIPSMITSSNLILLMSVNIWQDSTNASVTLC